VSKRLRVDLLPAEWAALGVVADGRAHGYDVARALGAAGELGKVWTVARPLVYRALQQLEAKGLVRSLQPEPSPAGPQRTLIAVTPAGRRVLAGWLELPVEHVRDVRSTLLLKLALHDRRGTDPAALLRAQRSVIEQLVVGLRSSSAAASGFDAILATWRLESALAVLRFIDALETQ
jgi:PadR family transcriptional regulator AphA